MKRSILMLVVAGLFTAMPVVAAEQEKHDLNSIACIQHCAQQSETIDQKIARLQNEIKKGNKSYSTEELRKLEAKLKEANDMLDAITRP